MDKLNFSPEAFEAYSGREEYEEEALEPYSESEAFDEFSPAAGEFASEAEVRPPPSASPTRRAPPGRPGRPATRRPPSRRPLAPPRGRPRPSVIRRPLARTLLVGAPSPPCVCPSHGTEFIRWVQSSLNQIQGGMLPVDGIMTVATRNALRRFQAQQGLPPDGIAGPETEKALIDAKATGANRPPPPDTAEPPAQEEIMQSEDSMFPEYNPEKEAFEDGQFAYETPWSVEVFSEADLMELAAGLLEVRDEAELDLFLGGLIRRAGQAIGQVVKMPVGKAIGGILKGTAKQALPLAGTAVGAYFGGPLGAKVGSGLASMAGKALGLELEGLSLEDQEFEGAKQFVKFAGETVKNAASGPPDADPRRAAQTAAVTAAQKFVPGLLRLATAGDAPAAADGNARTGRWIRQGRNIILANA
jgi:peptidoglycan hydrolase-like protein with peptidoglycan-binding domain